MNNAYNYLDALNEQQRSAVEYCDGPQLVIAGAGSGKTRVLTYKIVHLLRMGYEPYRILALTFTNKAAREMKDRISSVVGEHVASRLWMGTFHSIFLRILRKHADVIGFKPGFTIYDSSDSKSLIKLIIKEYGLDEKQYKPATVASIISNAKNAMMTPDQYEANYADIDRKSKRPMISRIYHAYAMRCRAANAMDFDDILFYMNILLRDNPDIAHHYQEFFRYILVDEYQDTNFAQHMVVSQLAKPDNRICVVGDDAQSIYSFRGANIGNIIDLEKAYPGLATFKLERNYRSTQNIVNAAGSLIEKNSRQLRKNVYSENAVGAPVEIIQTFSDLDEAHIVTAMIQQSKLTEHDSLDEYAILYRTNAQSRVLEEALRKENMPYRIVGGTAFYQRKEIKDVICYFRLCINPDDDEALRRVINFPTRGIGETTLKKVQAAASEANVSMWTVLDNPEKFKLPVNSGTQKKLDAFVSMIREFIADNEKSNAFELGQLVYNRTGILLLYAHDNTPESISRQENISELLNGLKDFTEAHLQNDEPADMASFLSEVSLATDADEKDQVEGAKVTMMTVHAAKGLEFKHIFIVGAEEELFPSAMSMDTISEIEEERRLMYVAITRAKETCVITHAKTRFRNGQPVMCSPSRFLMEINPKFLKVGNSKTGAFSSRNSESSFINHSQSRYSQPNAYKESSKSYISPHSTNSTANTARNLRPLSKTSASGITPQHDSSELKEGMRIRHQKLGEGTIIAIGQLGGDPSITVNFGASGTKKLLLKFAKFTIL